MNSMGFPPNWIWRPIAVLVAFVLGHYLLAGLLLQYNRSATSIAQARKTDVDLSAGKEKIAIRQNEARKVAVSLDNYALEIRKRNLFRQKSRVLTILRPITAESCPGDLNVIMGPSESGKTSLLNSIARRLRRSFGTQY